MPAAMNIRARHRADVAGMLRHDFRHYEPDQIPPQIDPDRVALNRTLCGDDAALEDLPQRQPDTGRKIRKDARVVASMVCTLPQELDSTDPAAVDQWAAATMRWLQMDCPGDVAYAVLHLDESRPHIHAALIPWAESRHLSYKAVFGDRQTLRDMQQSYAQALAPLGVESSSELVKAARRTQYTTGIHGWRVPGIVQELDERERALEADLEALAELDRPLGQLPPAQRGRPGKHQPLPGAGLTGGEPRYPSTGDTGLGTTARAGEEAVAGTAAGGDGRAQAAHVRARPQAVSGGGQAPGIAGAARAHPRARSPDCPLQNPR